MARRSLRTGTRGDQEEDCQPRLPTHATMMPRAYLLRIFTSFEGAPSPKEFMAVTT